MTFPDTATLATAGVTASSTVSVACTNQGAFTSPSTTARTARPAARKMKSGTNTVDYALYRDSASTQCWVTAPRRPSRSAAPARQQRGGRLHHLRPGAVGPGNKPIGTYSDTVTATVTF
jgi:spore coat protein U-like protein